MIRIAVDCMGGDYGPADMVAAVAAASLALEAELLLVGHERTLTALLSEREHDPERIGVYHAPDAIGRYEDVARAVSVKSDASIQVACRLLRDNEADVLVTAGNPDAVLVVAREHLQRISGIPAVASSAVFPTELRRGEKDDPFTLMLDLGASPTAGAAELAGYAVMGSAYAELISRNPRPRVALLSNGLDAQRCLPEIAEAAERLRERSDVRFIGMMEPHDIPRGTADVIVCAGFYGRLVIDLLEGTYDTALSMAKYAYKEKLVRRAGYTILRSGMARLKRVTDWEQYGGAPVLGFEKVLVQAHGRSHTRALVNALKVAAKVAGGDLVSTIEGRANPQPPVS